MPFLYHTAGQLPSRKAWPAALAHLHGLELHTRQVVRGPSGAGDGVVFAPQQFLEPGQVALVDRLTWRVVHGSESLRVAQVETPAALAKLGREQTVEGLRLVLDDGRRWLIPRVRFYFEEGDRRGWTTSVPQELELTDAGELVRGDPLPAYRSLWDTADAWNRLRLGTLEPSEMREWNDVRNWLAAAARIVAANYHIGLRELMLCGALRSQQTAERILDAAIDFDGLKALQKKSLETSASASPSPGAADSAPDTGRPPPT